TPPPRPSSALSLHDALPISVEIELAVADPGEMSIAQEVVATVYVERAAHRAREKGDGMPAAHEIDDALRERGVEAREDAMHLGRSEEHTSELQSRENLVCRL